MLRLLATSLYLHFQRTPSHLRSCATLTPSENPQTVETLYQLSVDLQKVRKLKGWVLRQNPAYAEEAAQLLKDLGASGTVVSTVLTSHPEAVLCHPEETLAQKNLWMSVCPNKKELVAIIEKFPASFFTFSNHDNQRDNIAYFRSLNLNKRMITKLMAGAPQSFGRPVEQNRDMVRSLQKTYLDLGGDEANMKVWLQKLLNQNPFVLLKEPQILTDNVVFLRERGFGTAELLHLLSKLKAFVIDLNPESMRRTLGYSKDVLGCSEAELRTIIVRCPALLYYPEDVLAERFAGLLAAGVSMGQIAQTPTVLELTTQIVNYRIQRLKGRGYDVRSSSLDVLNGTKKDFEVSFGRLQLRRERPLFNPVAPLKDD
ncbi:transcription termination factor 2, mitochondrial isoform X2 [Corythoichthys intestinalis]|nr:transcription termination factor 2, mitochondrial isoform X2 [Corythoichthys intestinalis]XP_057691986.1 transcription termination factor 2, mitochondrial isoform X2 [Corythoichthys intestinalis]XP_061812355.1 transcription termination factor 2, mitochondrial-like [Nerophis lumbriciformis]